MTRRGTWGVWLLFWLAQGASAQEPARAFRLLGGEVRNVSDLCGKPKALSVQFIGPVSLRIEVPPGTSVPVSVAAGFYQVTVHGQDGAPMEAPVLRVTETGYVVPFGCPPFSITSTSESVKLDNEKGLRVRFANTTQDCGDASIVAFLVNGDPAATVKPGAVVEGLLPSGPWLLEVVSLPENRRVFIEPLKKVERGSVLFYGCTDPEAQSRKEGVPALFENHSDKCQEPVPVTVWVNGSPWLGVLPGRAAMMKVPAGKNHFMLRQGAGLKVIMEEWREVRAPFRMRYGCYAEE